MGNAKTNHKLITEKGLALQHDANGFSKRIFMTYSIISINPDNSDNAQIYDGAILCINRDEFFTYLTKEEVGFLLYELNKIDINTLSAQAINAYLLLYKEKEENHTLEKSKPVQEIIENEIVDIKPLQKKSSLPDL